MLLLAGILALLLLAALLSRLAERSDRVEIRSCCGTRPWPPEDLVDPR